MSKHGYESGRLNLPFVGHCTFAKSPPVLDWDAIDADVAVLGAPFDMGTQYRAGARFGPRGIREASTLYSFGHDGAYDHEDDVVYMPKDQVTMVDIGDADIIHTDTEQSHANIEYAGHGNLMKRAAEKPYVLGISHLGIRNVSSTAREGYEDARRAKSNISTCFLAAQVLLDLLGYIFHERSKRSAER
jgi:agmatinase